MIVFAVSKAPQVSGAIMPEQTVWQLTLRAPKGGCSDQVVVFQKVHLVVFVVPLVLVGFLEILEFWVF